MLIPSIDLMAGKIVQLVQGERKALESSDFEYWTERFLSYPLVQVIDLDAAMCRGNNRALLERFTSRLRCQVGGGIRSVELAGEMLSAGACRVIVGSALLKEGRPDLAFADELACAVTPGKVIAALDARGGKVAVHGWRDQVAITPLELMRALEPYCGGFLYTHIDTEGLMRGIPLEIVRGLRDATTRALMAAGGIASQHEIDSLDAMGVDAVVGMAVYTGHLQA